MTSDTVTSALRRAIVTCLVLGGVTACSRDQAASTTTAPAVVTVTEADVSTATTAPSTSTTPAATTPAATTVAAATTEVPTTPPATAPPDTAATPTSGTAVVYASGGGAGEPWTPVGWWDGTDWVPAEADDSVDVPAASFATASASSVELSNVIDGLPVSAATDYFCVDDRVGPTIDLSLPPGTGPFGYGYRIIAVTADWPLQPRAVADVGADAEEYQSVGESLVPPGPSVVPANGDVEQVFRADLDGDGLDEVLFSFAYQADDSGFGNEGDFSIVVARHPHGDGSVTEQVLFQYLTPDPATAGLPSPGYGAVAAIADLNGDGVMEVALRSVFWESSVITIYELRDGSLHEIMSSGCGV